MHSPGARTRTQTRTRHSHLLIRGRVWVPQSWRNILATAFGCFAFLALLLFASSSRKEWESKVWRVIHYLLRVCSSGFCACAYLGTSPGASSPFPSPSPRERDAEVSAEISHKLFVFATASHILLALHSSNLTARCPVVLPKVRA